MKDTGYMAVSGAVSACMIYTAQLFTPEFYSWLYFLGYTVLAVIISSLVYLTVILGFYGKSAITVLSQIFDLLRRQVNRYAHLEGGSR